MLFFSWGFIQFFSGILFVLCYNLKIMSKKLKRTRSLYTQSIYYIFGSSIFKLLLPSTNRLNYDFISLVFFNYIYVWVLMYELDITFVLDSVCQLYPLTRHFVNWILKPIRTQYFKLILTINRIYVIFMLLSCKLTWLQLI